MIAVDSASTTYGLMDGTTLCGPRTYSIGPTSYSFFSLSVDILTLISTDPIEATSPLSITITATLDNYPLVSVATSTFTVELVDYCTSTTLNFDTAVINMQAFINLGAFT